LGFELINVLNTYGFTVRSSQFAYQLAILCALSADAVGTKQILGFGLFVSDAKY
jgi:hypothetical protein